MVPFNHSLIPAYNQVGLGYTRLFETIQRGKKMTEVISSKRLNTKQAAEYLGLAEQSLHNRRHLRQSPDYIKIGKSVRYDTRTLDEFLESNRIKLSA